MEVKGYAFKTEEEESFINELCELLDILNIDDDIVNEVIKLRKQYKVKLPDAIIIATAASRNMTLVTQNSKDFEQFSKLVPINSINL